MTLGSSIGFLKAYVLFPAELDGAVTKVACSKTKKIV